MRESALYRAIDAKLPRSIFHQSMTGSSMAVNGTFDRFYDGTRSDLWVEYKVWPSMPRSGTINVAPIAGRKGQPQGHLSHHQLRWGTRRWNTGRNAIVMVGLPDRRVLILSSPVLWSADVSINEAFLITEAAMWIQNFVGI